MAPKKSNKSTETQNLSKTRNAQKKNNDGIRELPSSQDPGPSSVPKCGIVLRRSSRKLTITNDTSVNEISPTKRFTKIITDCEPITKKARVHSSQSKTNGTKTDSSKKKSVSRTTKKNKTELDVDEKQNEINTDHEQFIDDKCDIDQLPSEILTEIFSYLSFRDRKSARLTCRRWFEASNVMQFAYEETLLCYALYDFHIIIDTLMNSQRKILNLEFYDIKFEDIPWSLDFWIKCGPKIESLLFSDCVFTDDTVKHVIKHCDKLKCLSLENMSTRSDGQKMCSDSCLDQLMQLQIRRENLYFLEININETGWISNYFLSVLFTIFPGIKQFSFYCDTVEDDFNVGTITDEALLQSTEKCSFNGILRKLVDLQLELDSLTLDVGDYQTLDSLPGYEICRAISSLYFPELRDIKVDLEIFSEQQTSVINFFSRHKQLQSVECQIFVEMSTNFVGKFVHCLLNSCPNLQCLQIVPDVYSNLPVMLDASVFTKLVKSMLTSLTFNFNMEIVPSNIDFVNYYLKSLCILAPGVEKDMFLTLSKTFCGLTHLEMINLDDDMLQSIVKYQTNLTSLKLIDCQKCTDYGFTGCHPDGDNSDQSKGYSIQRLSKLQYLEIKMTNDPPKITKATFNELRFPNLLYLHVSVETPWELQKEFVQMLSNFSKLEGLACYFNDVTDYFVWLELCGKLKKLRYLHIQYNECESFGEKKYKQIFACCPTLRALQHRCSWGRRAQSYYYDIVKKKVVKKKSDREYRISSEQIDTFSVNWMWF